jgi:AcrR family transcriptional regulator
MVTSDPGRARPARGQAEPEARDRAATRARILAAVGRILARDGFSGLGVNAVAREAGADKVLLYRYFGGIEGLLDAWGEAALAAPEAGPASPAAPDGEALAARSAAALARWARRFRAHPEALEIMRWELLEDNALTRRVAALREAAGRADLERLRVPRDQARAVDLPAVAALLSAGLLHLALRARTAPEWLGVPLRSDDGWARLERAAAALVHGVLEGPRPVKRRPSKRPAKETP